MSIKRNKAFLYQSGKGVKVLLLGFEEKMFDVDSSLPFQGLLENNMNFVSEFQYEQVDDLLLLLKPDILISKNDLKTRQKSVKIVSGDDNYKVIKIEHSLCLACQADEKNLQKYYLCGRIVKETIIKLAEEKGIHISLISIRKTITDITGFFFFLHPQII